jgi:mannose-6-phosphate isomerase-like protein (cupin superfamily)
LRARPGAVNLTPCAEEQAMRAFETKSLAAVPDARAPDGTSVRLLAALAGGSFAHFELPAGAVSNAIAHRTVEEIWWFVAGRGELWRAAGDHEEVVAVGPGVCATIPLGTRFQFRASPDAPLAFVAVTMPPWPGEEEAVVVAGHWAATAA